jgi:hypothetical protein
MKDELDFEYRRVKRQSMQDEGAPNVASERSKFASGIQI